MLVEVNGAKTLRRCGEFRSDPRRRSNARKAVPSLAAWRSRVRPQWLQTGIFCLKRCSANRLLRSPRQWSQHKFLARECVRATDLPEIIGLREKDRGCVTM